MFVHFRRAMPRVFFNDGGAGGGAGGGGAAGQFGMGGAPAGGAPAGGAPAGGAPAGGAPDGGQQQQPWYAGIQDQATRDLMASKAFDTPEKVASAYVHANRALGGAKDIVAIPGEGATPEQQNAFYKQLGRPDAPEGYQFRFDPNGPKVDEGFTKAAQGFFHKAGLSPAQAQTVIDNWQAYIGPRMQQEQAQQEQQIQAGVDKIKTELGANFEPARQKGGAFINSLGLSQDSANWLAQNGGANAVIELIARVGSKLTGEGGLITAGGGQGGGGDIGSMTKEQAASEIIRLSNDAEFNKAYLDKNNAGHKEAVQKMSALYARRAA